MEIRFPTDDESPHYLSQFVFSRAGDAILIEVTDQRNNQKCATLVDLENFKSAMSSLGAIKCIETEQVIRLKDF